ncbi:MAG TPA: hypothetical protein VH331_15695 [Allosphingosinicella sp.]|jgi:hypothetical protein|nr:hypothetical protein [Allosphingosinicella sp.]
MTPQDKDDLWRNRFIMVNLLRIGATIFCLIALAIWQTNLLVPGGSIVGLPLALAGLVLAFWGPSWLARHWKRQDGR